jgi:hypothetical protein
VSGFGGNFHDQGEFFGTVVKIPNSGSHFFNKHLIANGKSFNWQLQEPDTYFLLFFHDGVIINQKLLLSYFDRYFNN